MNVGLIHNARAGDASSASDLAAAIARHGHRVCGLAQISDGLAGWDLRRLDLVAAAGGDGTIAWAARAVAGSGVPLAVLPMGTANNIAASLGLPPSTDEIIMGWGRAVRRPFDLGLASGPWGQRRFVESVGGGLVTHGMVVMDRRAPTDATPIEQVARARRAHAGVLELLRPVPWRIAVDGRDVSGSYLLVEVLNIRSVGPNLSLAADASPWDGWFHVVAAAAEHRPALLRYLRGDDGSLDGLLTWPARRVVIEAGDRLHADDEVLEEPAGRGVTLDVEPGALHVLVP